MTQDLQVHVCLLGDEASRFSCIVSAKWAKQPFADVVLIPFLNLLQANAEKWKGATLQMLAGVQVNEGLARTP